MRFVTRCSFLFLIALSAAAFAAPRAHVPSLTVAGDDGSVALKLEALRVDVLIRGHLARTTYELTFRNPLDTNADGNFAFPLPVDGEVSDLGLYFGVHLRHAAAVERVQARAAYERTVHKRVDPALAEWTASSRAFHFRVFPIPANGTKVVHIAIDQELTSVPYELDLRYDTKLAAVDLSIDSDATFEGEGLGVHRGGGVWSLHRKDMRLDTVIRATRDASEIALAGYSIEDKAWYVSAPVRIHSTAREIEPAPQVTLLVDASASAVQRDDAKLRAFLAPFLAKQRGGASIAVVPFHINVEAARTTDAAGLERTLATIPAAGATNLVEMLEKLPSLARSSPAARLVLVTDGINTLGDSQRLAQAIDHVSQLRRPLTIINASESADDNFLGGLARATGGNYIDLTHMETADAVESAMRQPARMMFSTQLPLRDMLPASLLATNDTNVTISARSSDHEVVFPVITAEGRHDIPIQELSSPNEADLVRRAWARARLRSLLDSGATPEAILEHGRTFNQLTPRTSLLVLESWRDYDVNGVPMPADVRAERDAELAAERERVKAATSHRQSFEVRGTTSETPPSAAAVWYMKGTVTMDDASPLPGATVTMIMDDRTPQTTTVTDANGRFWLTRSTPPSSAFVVKVELPGLNTATRRFPKETPKGAVAEIVMKLTAVAESITVTAEAPLLSVNAEMAGGAVARELRQKNATIADQLLASLASDAPPPEDDDVAEKSLAQRLDLVQQVVAKLRSLSSADDRFRYYLAARSVIGSEKLFQANAALAIRDDSPELAVRWLTDLAEANPDDAATLRILGRVLDAWGRADLARLMFERALELSPRETQTWRELMLLDAKEGREKELEELQHRYSIYERDSRMEQTDDAIDFEMKHRRPGADPRRDETAELQIESMWDSNYTDVDLHVIEPDGEEVFYNHLESKHAGRLHADVTTGFGPETYTIAHMQPGQYQIVLEYYGGDSTRTTQETLAHVIVYVRGERRDVFVVLAKENDKRPVAIVTR